MGLFDNAKKSVQATEQYNQQVKSSLTPSAPVAPKSVPVSQVTAYAPGSKKAKEQQRKALYSPQSLLTGSTGPGDNTYMEDYMLAMPGLGPLLAKSRPDLAQNAIRDTQNLFNEHPVFAGVMEGLNPVGSTKNYLERQFDQNIDTSEAESKPSYIAGNMAGLAGQYLITGGIGEGALTQGIKNLPRFASLGAKGLEGKVAQNVIAGAGANTIAGLPLNLITSMDMSKQDDGSVSAGEFGKQMAINTALDVALGGAIEGVSAFRRLRKLSKEKQAELLKKVSEQTGIDENEIKLLAEPSVNWDYGTGKIPDFYASDTGVAKNFADAEVKQLPAPAKVLNKKETPKGVKIGKKGEKLPDSADFYVSPGGQTAKDITTADIKQLPAPKDNTQKKGEAFGYADKQGVDKIKAKSEVYRTIKEALKIESRDDSLKLSEVLRKIDTNEKDGWDNDEFWGGIMDLAKKQVYEEIDPEKLYPGLKAELRDTGIKVTDDIKNTVDFNAVRKNNFGKVKFIKDGREIDKVYNSLSERYPDLFPGSVVNPADQMEKVIDVANNLKPMTKTIGDAMSDDDLWTGPLGKVWGSVEKYRGTVKESVSYANAKGLKEAPTTAVRSELSAGVQARKIGKESKLPKKLPKKPEDIYANAKGQKEVPKTITKAEQAGKGLPKQAPKAELPKETLKPKELPKKEVKPDDTRRADNNRSEARSDSRTEAIIEKLHRSAKQNPSIKSDRRLYEASDHPYRKRVESIAKKFGTDVVFVKPLTDDADYFNGINLDGVIVISDKSENPINVVLGHEVMHQLKRDFPVEYEKFASILSKEVESIKYAKYAKIMESAGKDAGIEYKNGDILEEMASDFSGEMFNNPTIMRRIFDEDRNLAQKVYDIISEMIKTLKQSIRDTYIVSDGIKNLQKVQDEYVKLMKQAKLNDANPATKMYRENKFSLKKPVEETKDLIAIHNLNERKLNGILDLGGFPVPSIAVTKVGLSHDSFGDISILFGKDTINPTDRRNRIFASDIYSTRFPQVSYKLNEKAVKKFNEKIRTIVDSEYFSAFNSAIDHDNMSDKVDRYGNIVEAYKDDPILKVAFLKEQGKTFKPVMKEKTFGGWDYKLLQKINDELPETIGNRWFSVEEYTSIEPKLRKILNDYYVGEMPELRGRKPMYDSEIGFGKADSLLDNVKAYMSDSKRTEIDRFATRDKLGKVVNQESFEKWLSDISGELIEKKGIRNSKDLFTPSGSRRSWDQLHQDYNLESVTKEMIGNPVDNEGFNFGIGNIRANLSKEFKSIQSMKESKNRLVSYEDFLKFKEETESEFTELANKYAGRHSSGKDFGFLDIFSSALGFTAKGGATRQNLLKELKADGFDVNNISDDMVQETLNFLDKLKNAPTEYFEAKPQRAVGFDEVKAVVIPKTTSKDLKAKLKERNMNVIEYNPSIEGDRVKKINSVEGIKFSLKRTKDEVTIPYLKNTAKAPNMGKQFAQDIEPKGEYINYDSLNGKNKLPGYEYGEITFKHPLVMEYKTTGHGGWKTDLSKMYGGKKGQALSDAIVKDGYDAIITKDPDGSYNEIVNLNGMKPGMKRELPAQEISSAETSLNQVPGLLKEIEFKPGNRNFDYGGGKYDTATMYLKGKDVENLVYDRFNRSTDHNDAVLSSLEKKPADTATISNVLNVIKEKDVREFVLRDASRYVKKDGKIYISVYEGSGSGIGKETTKGWQNNRTTADYMDEISEVFGADRVTRKGKTIIVDLSGYDNQKFSLKRGMESGLHRERVKKELAENGEYQEIIKELEDVIIDDDPIIEHISKRIKDHSGLTMDLKDVYRNMRDAFGKDYPIIKEKYLDPFDSSKKDYVDTIKKYTDVVHKEITQDLKIRKGSKESQAVQWIGEGKRQMGWEWKIDEETGKKYKTIKLVDYDLDDLKKDFPTKWQDIQKASEKMRQLYDELIDEVNESRRKIYPTNPSKLVPKRKDYFRHYREMSSSFQGLWNVFSSSTNIDPKLAGISEFTAPKSRWASYMQQRGMGKYKEDAIGGFLDYISPASYSINIDPHINQFRSLAKQIAEATVDTKNANNTIAFLHDFANSLAGKTVDWDRLFTKKVGRKPLVALTMLNNRVKKNQILMNARSALSQVANIPLGIAKIKNPMNLVPGAGDAITSMIGANPRVQGLYNRSQFISERYSRNLLDRFDTRWIDMPEKMAGWLLEGADQIGTKFIWNSAYRNAVGKGIENPIKYADDLTRSLVAGRGIGEVPLLQQSKVFQMVAPFQLEVTNLWHVFGDMRKEKDFGGILLILLGNWLFNNAYEEAVGDRIVFDPIDAIAQSIKEGNGPGKTSMRLAGEMLGNIPLGQTFATLYPEYGMEITVPGTEKKVVELPSRKEVFGDKDPTRYGSGILLQKAVQDPLYKLLPPLGGNQAKKTIEAVTSLKKGEVSKDGKMNYLVENKPENVVKGALFGKYAFDEAKTYTEKDRRPLTEKQSDEIRKSKDPEKAYEKKMVERRMDTIDDKIKDVKKNDEMAEEQKNKEIVKLLREKMSEIKTTTLYTDAEKKKKILDLQGKILKYQK